MADDVDYASDMEADFTARAIEANRKSAQKLIPRQKCYNCDSPLEGDRLFCDHDCQKDWEFRIRRTRGHEIFSGAK